MYADLDTRRYLEGYPKERDDTNKKKNLEFYSNERPSQPSGDYIVDIHKKWKGNYGLLESHHGFIQWLFPIREDGLNHYAQRLQLHEANAIKDTPLLQGRVVTSYALMLDFYGMKLDKETGMLKYIRLIRQGEISRSDNYKERFRHLNRSFHNYLRITRILKCLGEVGLEHLKIHFIRFVLKEIFETKELDNCEQSCVRFWAAVLRNEEDREEVSEYIAQHRKEPPKSRGFSWTSWSKGKEKEKKGKKGKKGEKEEKQTEKDEQKGVKVTPKNSNGDVKEDFGKEKEETKQEGEKGEKQEGEEMKGEEKEETKGNAMEVKEDLAEEEAVKEEEPEMVKEETEEGQKDGMETDEDDSQAQIPPASLECM